MFALKIEFAVVRSKTVDKLGALLVWLKKGYSY